MKPILYLSAALMISASIYGFVDYKKTTRTAAFKNMYEDKEVKTREVVPQETVVEMTDPVDKPKIVTPEKNIEKEKPGKKAITKKTNRTTSKSNVLKRQKKLNTKLFSRAPLREYPEIEETPKIEKVKSKQ